MTAVMSTAMKRLKRSMLGTFRGLRSVCITIQWHQTVRAAKQNDAKGLGSVEWKIPVRPLFTVDFLIDNGTDGVQSEVALVPLAVDKDRRRAAYANSIAFLLFLGKGLPDRRQEVRG